MKKGTECYQAMLALLSAQPARPQDWDVYFNVKDGSRTREIGRARINLFELYQDKEDALEEPLQILNDTMQNVGSLVVSLQVRDYYGLQTGGLACCCPSTHSCTHQLCWQVS